MNRQTRSTDTAPVTAERCLPAQVEELPRHQARYGAPEEDTPSPKVQPEAEDLSPLKVRRRVPPKKDREDSGTWWEEAGVDTPRGRAKPEERRSSGLTGAEESDTLTPRPSRPTGSGTQRHTNGAVSSHMETAPFSLPEQDYFEGYYEDYYSADAPSPPRPAETAANASAGESAAVERQILPPQYRGQYRGGRWQHTGHAQHRSTARGRQRAAETASTGKQKPQGSRKHTAFRVAAYAAASSSQRQEDSEQTQELHRLYYYGGALPVRLLGRAKQYTRQLLAGAAKARTLVTEKAVVAHVLRAAVPLLFCVAVLLSLLLAVLLPTMTLKSELEDMAEAYLYVTELDAEKTKEIREAMPGGGGTFYVNGYPVSRVTLQTDVDYLMLYFTAKCEDFTLDTRLTQSAYGGATVRQELRNIHRQLYSYRVRYTTDEEGNSVLDGIYVTSRSVSELLDGQLTEDERELMDTISSVGVYTAYQSLSLPFEGYAYVKERWGAYVDSSGSIAYRTGAVLAAGRSSAVLACESGKVTKVAANTVCIEAEDGSRVEYGNLSLLLVSPGQQVRTGDEIGAVSSDLQLTCYSADGSDVNPAFLLPSSVEYSSGSGDGSDIVAAALTQLGQSGGQPYWSWYGFGGRVDWCACFVSWCADRAGCLQTAVPRFSLVDDGELWYKSRGLWQRGGSGYVPRAGDVIFFDWEGDGMPNHVGIVESCDGALICTVEGNSGDYPGTVRVRYYDLYSRVIYGFGTPEYG